MLHTLSLAQIWIKENEWELKLHSSGTDTNEVWKTSFRYLFVVIPHCSFENRCKKHSLQRYLRSQWRTVQMNFRLAQFTWVKLKPLTVSEVGRHENRMSVENGGVDPGEVLEQLKRNDNNQRLVKRRFNKIFRWERRLQKQYFDVSFYNDESHNVRQRQTHGRRLVTGSWLRKLSKASKVAHWEMYIAAIKLSRKCICNLHSQENKKSLKAIWFKVRLKHYIMTKDMSLARTKSLKAIRTDAFSTWGLRHGKVKWNVTTIGLKGPIGLRLEIINWAFFYSFYVETNTTTGKNGAWIWFQQVCTTYPPNKFFSVLLVLFRCVSTGQGAWKQQVPSSIINPKTLKTAEQKHA